MKYLSFKILIICILLPPVLYLFSINFLEGYLTKRFYKDIQNIYLSGITEILNGQVEIKEGITNSIETYLQKNFFQKLGAKADISITTKTGNILYPYSYENNELESLPADPIKLAEKNFNLLNEGIHIDVEAKIAPRSFLGVSILLFYVLGFLGWLYAYYHKSITRALDEESKRKEQLDQLISLENERQKRIESLSEERENLLSDHQRLQKALESEKLQAEKTEDELFDEIEELDKKLNMNLSMQQEHLLEIDKLKEKIHELEKDKEIVSRQKQKEADKIGKRIRTLYKNIDITSRALENLADMTEEMGLKAEEIIHLLNDDSSAVPVKRKVFTRKGNITAFEVIFAYSARLYFRKTRENRVEILTVGTKNTQARDLVYLDNL